MRKLEPLDTPCLLENYVAFHKVVLLIGAIMSLLSKKNGSTQFKAARRPEQLTVDYIQTLSKNFRIHLSQTLLVKPLTMRIEKD